MIFIHSGRKPLVVIEPFKENLEDVSENFNTKNIQIKSDFEISMENAFENCYNFNQNISYWDVSKVTNMSSMFKNARKFNQSLYYWDVSKVTDMSSMFEGAALFNDNDIR
nr:BspA family leucine-rich repeat surface protein [Mycoplasma phocoeninasale]